MYINYSIKKGHEYASVTNSVRKGNTTVKENSIYLGRVVDKEKNIFKNRERGLFVYDIKTNTFSSVPPEYQEPKITRKTKYRRRPVLDIAFGDVFLLHAYLKEIGFYKVIEGIKFRNLDTIYALLSFYVLCKLSNSCAQTWFDLSYAKFLFPQAQLSSQRISDALKDIGSEEARRGFFKEYVPFLKERNLITIENGVVNGILIDSTGLPNAVHMPITAVSNHNGVINEEVRLIYAVQQSTGIPLFYRYVSGNVVDVSTLLRTIVELEANSITTKFLILDAGYYTGKNADELYERKIDFLCRMKGNYKVYRNIIAGHLVGLDSKSNFIRHHGRRYYIKHVPCLIGTNEDLPAHAYLCKDVNVNDDQARHLCAKAEDQNMSDDELYDEMIEKGVFVLVSSKEVATKELLPLYYTRDQAEKAFNISKHNAKILPLNVEDEDRFRGHILMSFMATIIVKMLKDKLKEQKKKKSRELLTVEKMFFVLNNHRALVYENDLLINEAVAEANLAYSTFGINVPVSIPINES